MDQLRSSRGNSSVKIDLETLVVRARLRGGVGIGGVVTLEGEAIRDADHLRRIEGDGDVTEVGIWGPDLTGGGDEGNIACPPRLYQQEQKEMEQCSLEHKCEEADQLPCDVSQYLWAETLPRQSVHVGSNLRWIDVDRGTLVLSSRPVITENREEGKTRTKIRTHCFLWEIRSTHAFVTCPILSAAFKFRCPASRLQQHLLGYATEANCASAGRLRNVLLASEPQGQCKGRIGDPYLRPWRHHFLLLFVDFLSYSSVLDRGGGQWVLDIAQCITRGALRIMPDFWLYLISVSQFADYHSPHHRRWRRSNTLPNDPSITISVRTSVSACAQVPYFNNSNAQKLGSTPRRRFDDICWNPISIFFLVVNYSNPPSVQLCTRAPAASQLIGNRKIPSFQSRMKPPTSNSLFV